MNGTVPEVDPQHPSVARIYDYYLGGTHNFAADRRAGDAAIAAMPDLPAVMRVNREFLRRAVTAAARDGVTQFLDLGSGIPTEGSVHEAARAVEAASRVVYVDIEPVAVVHGRRVLAGDDGADILLADLVDAPAVLASEPVRHLLDLSRPVCLLAVAVGHFLPDTERLVRALATYRDALAAGSWLVMSHGTADGEPEQAERVRRIYNNTTAPMVLRGRDEVLQLFGDWPLLEPGLTTAARWRTAAGTAPVSPIVDRSILAAVARKP
jgi:hypothetical protein